MYFERKELIQSLDLACYVLHVYVWLLDGRTLWLAFRCLLQIQFNNPTHILPKYRLPILLVIVSIWNGLGALLHLVGPVVVSSGKESSLMLDFVGQQYSPSRLHMAFIDMVECIFQLTLLTIAFEMGQDDKKTDNEPSVLDVTPRDTGEPQGQGWDVRDEEATLFTQSDPQDQATSLSHPIAVIRPAELWKQIREISLATEVTQPPTPAPEPVDPSRPDTSRIRRFSRRNAPPTTAPAQAAEASVDDSWPPMWLVIARNMVGTRQPISLLRRPTQALTSLRTTLTSRFSSNTAPDPPTT